MNQGAKNLPRPFAHESGQHLTTEERILWLRQVRLFQDIKDIPKAIEHIDSLMELHHYHADAAILTEGEEGQDAYFLVTGSLKVLKTTTVGERFPVAVLEAKDHPFFGEATLLETDRRSATILTLSPCTCLSLNRSAFAKLCENHPEWALPVALRVARVLLDRLHKANDDVILLYNALVREVKGI